MMYTCYLETSKDEGFINFMAKLKLELFSLVMDSLLFRVQFFFSVMAQNGISH